MKNYTSKLINLDSIIPYPDNPKIHDEEQIALLAGRIAKEGFNQPIVVDANMVIVKGHGRRLAASKLGLEKVPVVVLSDLTKAEIKAARIADNAILQRTDYNKDKLNIELEGLVDLNIDLVDIGFDDFMINKLNLELNEINLEPEPEEKIDKPEPKGRETYDVNAVNDEIDLLMGFKTAMTRKEASAPMAFYDENKMLTGDVLDFGAGMDKHPYTKYDPYYQFEPKILRKKYDTIACNYVLNVQAHVGARMNTLLAIRSLLNKNGRALISVMTTGDNGGEEKMVRSSRGFQVYYSRENWESEIKNIFKYVKKISSNFAAWECSDENIL